MDVSIYNHLKKMIFGNNCLYVLYMNEIIDTVDFSYNVLKRKFMQSRNNMKYLFALPFSLIVNTKGYVTL